MVITLTEIHRRIRAAGLTKADIDALLREERAANGRKGGQATSEAKRLAAAANGSKGGRPPKKRRKPGKPNND